MNIFLKISNKMTISRPGKNVLEREKTKIEGENLYYKISQTVMSKKISFTYDNNNHNLKYALKWPFLHI